MGHGPIGRPMIDGAAVVRLTVAVGPPGPLMSGRDRLAVPRVRHIGTLRTGTPVMRARLDPERVRDAYRKQDERRGQRGQAEM